MYEFIKMSLCLSLLAVQWHFSAIFFLQWSTPFVTEIQSKQISPIILDFINKHHRGKSSLCHADILYQIIVFFYLICYGCYLKIWPAISAYLQTITWALLIEYHFQRCVHVDIVTWKETFEMVESVWEFRHMDPHKAKQNVKQTIWTGRELNNISAMQFKMQNNVWQWLFWLLATSGYICAVIKALPQHLDQYRDWNLRHVCELNLNVKHILFWLYH